MSHKFDPDYASPPGETIAEILDNKELSVAAFSILLDVDLEFVERLLRGEERITRSLGSRLATILGPPEDFWLERDRRYVALVEKLKK